MKPKQRKTTQRQENNNIHILKNTNQPNVTIPILPLPRRKENIPIPAFNFLPPMPPRTLNQIHHQNDSDKHSNEKMNEDH